MASIKSDLRSLVTSDGAMILDIAADELTTLNSTGGYVWGRLREGIGVEVIIEELVMQTGQDPRVVASDVKEFVETLAANQVISI